MISPISPAFSSELWEGFRSKVTHCGDCDMNKGVQDQSWPKLDVDSVMLLIVKCNSMQIYDVYIPYTKFNNLTKEEAIAYSQGHNIYKDNFQGHEVKRISFYVKKDYMAMIEYFIPSLDNKIVQKLQKKKKKMS